MAIDFLTFDDVIGIYEDQIERYGGRAGIRDMNALLSAIAMPQAAFDGKHLHADLFEMAAAYFFHLVQNHPFIDGNKRAGTAAALVFLDLNGIEVTIDDDCLAEFVLEVAQGRHDKNAIAAFLRKHTSSG